MDGNFWLLLLIIVIAGLVGGAILFLIRYAKLKENVNRMLKDSRDELLRQRENIRTSNREYLALFPGQDGGKADLLARSFRGILRGHRRPISRACVSSRGSTARFRERKRHP